MPAELAGWAYAMYLQNGGSGHGVPGGPFATYFYIAIIRKHEGKLVAGLPGARLPSATENV